MGSAFRNLRGQPPSRHPDFATVGEVLADMDLADVLGSWEREVGPLSAELDAAILATWQWSHTPLFRRAA
jgi:hypothetical protein